MVTRYYFPDTGAPDVSPAYAGWTSTGADRRKCVTTKIASAFADKSIAGLGANTCFRQYVSDPIEGQIISGTLKGQISCRATNASNFTEIIVRVVSNDGSTFRGTLVNYSASSTGMDTGATNTNRKFKTSISPITIIPVTAQPGDRIVIEVGVYSTGSGTAWLNFGDSSVNDLPEDETSTAVYCPWVEFSQTIVEYPKFFGLRYIKSGVSTRFENYLIDFTLEKELEKMLDKLTLKISRAVDDEISWFFDFTPDTEIVLAYKSTNIFRGRVKTREKKEVYTVEVFSCGEIMGRSVANKIYESQAVETVFNDLMTTYTDLTPSSSTSGYTVQRFVAVDYVDSMASKLAQILDWQIRTDGDKKIYFQPRGNTTNANVLSRTSGVTNCLIGEWEKDSKELANHLIIRGADIEYQTQENFNGTGVQTEFTLASKPKSLKVMLSGVEQARTTYTVKPEDKKIIFNSAPPSGTGNVQIAYSYVYPLYLEKTDNASISAYGRFKKNLTVKWLKNSSDATQYASDYLVAYAQPLLRNTVTLTPEWVALVNIGEKIRVDDNLELIDDYFVINKIVFQYRAGKVELSIGPYIPQFAWWGAQVQDRIKEIEKSQTTDMLQLYQGLAESSTVSETLTQASASYINFRLATNNPKTNNGRGSTNDSRTSMCRAG